MHERAIGREFKKAERRHLDAFQQSGKAINEKVRLYAAVGKALIDAKIKAADPFAEIEKLMPWEAFLVSVEEAAKLSLPEDFDYLVLVGNGYSYIRVTHRSSSTRSSSGRRRRARTCSGRFTCCAT